jgi:phosphatidylcholine synthase
MHTWQRQTMAWAVHAYTMLGGVVALFGLLEALYGDMENAMLIIMLAYLIDGTDGLLARAVRVREVLPDFSGELIDHLIDFFSYIWLPAILMYEKDLVPHPLWIAVPVLASLYSYGVSTKTEDSFFQGFPSLWNVVMLYMYYLPMSDGLSVVILLIHAALIFLPTKYLYPSKNRFLSKPTWALSLLWVLLWVYILTQDQSTELVYLSLFFPAYYFAASFYATYVFGRAQAKAAA